MILLALISLLAMYIFFFLTNVKQIVDNNNNDVIECLLWPPSLNEFDASGLDANYIVIISFAVQSKQVHGICFRTIYAC